VQLLAFLAEFSVVIFVLLLFFAFLAFHILLFLVITFISVNAIFSVSTFQLIFVLFPTLASAYQLLIVKAALVFIFQLFI
jgi:hypothetical protein